MSAVCPVCDNPQDQGLACHSCVLRLEQELATVRDLMAELDVSISKQARIGNAGAPGLARERSPINVGAMLAADDLTNTLTTWARDVSGKRWSSHVTRLRIYRDPESRRQGPLCFGFCWHESCNDMETFENLPTPPAAVQAVEYLTEAIDPIRRHPAVSELHDEIIDAIRTARRAIDRPQDRVYLGQCMVVSEDEVTCLADVYARPNANTTTCKTCGVTHEVAERRAWLLQQAADRLFTVKEAAQMMGDVGHVRVTESRIRGYIHRQRLAYHPIGTGKGIRLGDLLAVVIDEGERKTA